MVAALDGGCDADVFKRAGGAQEAVTHAAGGTKDRNGNHTAGSIQSISCRSRRVWRNCWRTLSLVSQSGRR